MQTGEENRDSQVSLKKHLTPQNATSPSPGGLQGRVTLYKVLIESLT
jgi:hypothetical protein